MPVNYNLVRSRRKTLSIKVKDGQVTVYAPLLYPQYLIGEFVSNHEDWIDKQLNRNFIALNFDISKDEFIYVQGIKLKLDVDIAKESSLRVENSTLYLRGKSAAAMERLLTKWFCQLIETRVLIQKNRLGVDFDYSFRYYRSRWGCCNKKEKHITMNVYAAGLPTDVLDSIICHEIAHLKVANHQKEFYDVLYKICPNYKEINKRLKQYHIG